MMNTVDRTVSLFDTGLSCSQALLTAFGEEYGLDADTAKKLGRALAGGMGRLAKTCGAVSAAVLVLGMAQNGEEEVQARDVSFSQVQQFFSKFESLHGTTECRILLGADMGTEEGMRKIKEEELTKRLCPAFVRDAAAILEKLLAC